MKISGLICTIMTHILCEFHDPTVKNKDFHTWTSNPGCFFFLVSWEKSFRHRQNLFWHNESMCTWNMHIKNYQNRTINKYRKREAKVNKIRIMKIIICTHTGLATEAIGISKNPSDIMCILCHFPTWNPIKLCWINILANLCSRNPQKKLSRNRRLKFTMP